jgi:hypothetical protein
MSRRISLWLVASAATLVAPSAFADRECFDKSCKLMPAVVEPPPAPAVQAPPQELPNVPPETEGVADEARAQARAEAPVRAQPRMVVDPPARRQMVSPPPRYDDNAGPRPLRPAEPRTPAREIVEPKREVGVEKPDVRVVHKTPRAAYGFLPAGAAYGYRAEYSYRIAPGYIIAPDARIITIETND